MASTDLRGEGSPSPLIILPVLSVFSLAFPLASILSLPILSSFLYDEIDMAYNGIEGLFLADYN